MYAYAHVNRRSTCMLAAPRATCERSAAKSVQHVNWESLALATAALQVIANEKKVFLIVCYLQSRIALLSLLACAETKCVPAAPALGLGCETVHPLRAPNAALGGAKTAATAGSLARTASDLAALLRLANVEVGFSRRLHDTRGVLLPSLRHASSGPPRSRSLVALSV